MVNCGVILTKASFSVVNKHALMLSRKQEEGELCENDPFITKALQIDVKETGKLLDCTVVSVISCLQSL